MFERYDLALKHLEECLRVKATWPVEDQAEHIQRQTESEILARFDGYQRCMEDMLHEHNCYAGFMYVGEIQRHEGSTSRQSVGLDHPEFREWRRTYFTNGIAKG